MVLSVNKIEKFTNNSVDKILIEMFSDHFGIQDVSLNTKLSDLDAFDSLDEIELVMLLEQKFNININDDYLEERRADIKRVRDIKNNLKEKYNIIDIREERKQKLTKIVGDK